MIPFFLLYGWLLASLADAQPVIAEQGVKMSTFRAASLNLCMDQNLFALLPRERIFGLSPYVFEPSQSAIAEQAKGLRALSGQAEEILFGKPDLIFMGRFGRRETSLMLEAKGVKVISFAPPDSLTEARLILAAMGRILQAEGKVAEIERSLTVSILRLQEKAIAYQTKYGKKLRVLPLARRGWVPGEKSLVGDVFSLIGWQHAAPATKIPAQGQMMALESILALKPDILLVLHTQNQLEDQGSAMLDHAALLALVPKAKRFYIPESLFACGGPELIQAFDQLAAQLAGGIDTSTMK